MNGETLQYSETVEYLGVRISAHGVTELVTLERLRRAETRIRQLRAAGINRPRISSLRLRYIYSALVLPCWT